jgi:hypothetical protein
MVTYESGFFHYFFSEPQARVFSELIYWFLENYQVKCSHIPEPYPQRLSLKFWKRKKSTTSSRYYSTSVLSQAYCNRKNHVVLHQMNGGQIHNTRRIYFHPEHKHFCSIKPSNHMQLVLHTRGNLDWLMYTMYIKASSNMCIQSIWKGSIII